MRFPEGLASLLAVGPSILAPLFLVSFLMWTVIIGRLLALWGSPSAAILPGERRRRARALERLRQALAHYQDAPGDGSRAALLAECSAFPTPVGSAIRGFFQADEDGIRDDLRPLLVREAEVLGEREIGRGLGFLASLTHAAALTALLAAVSGLSRTLHSMMVFSTGDPRAWAAGAPTLLLGALVGGAVALCGVAARICFSARARSLRAELHLACRRLLGESGEAA